MITPSDLEELTILEAAATPGPWYARDMDDDHCCGATAVATRPNTSADNDDLLDASVHGIVAATYIQNPPYVLPEDQRGRENAALIAAMRTALPELLRVAALGLAAEQASAPPRVVNHPA